MQHASPCLAFDSFQMPKPLEWWTWSLKVVQSKDLREGGGLPGARLQADHCLAKAPWFDPFWDPFDFQKGEILKGNGLRLHLWSSPRKMSGEKVNTMKALGAEILRTPTEARPSDVYKWLFSLVMWIFDRQHGMPKTATSSCLPALPKTSATSLAYQLHHQLQWASNSQRGGHVLDQYKNAGNPLAHYDGTAEEIAEQCEGGVAKKVCTMCQCARWICMVYRRTNLGYRTIMYHH